MDDIIKILQSLENSDLLIDGATETVKHEIKKPKKVDFCLICSIYGFSIDATLASLLIKAINRKGDKRPGKEQEGGFPPLLFLPLMI